MSGVMLALPSKGAIAEPTLNFLQDCGLRVEKPNPRQYTGSIPALPEVDVLFQRVIDVAYKVAEGTAQLGVTGVDVVAEYGNSDLVIVHPDLQFGQCRLVVAVPEAWIDVESMLDLADVALDFREFHGRNLRVATTYPRNTRQFLHAHGIHHFTIVQAEGAIEAAPTIGHADIIVDLVQTGTTLRENHLKALPDGVVVESQACLIGHRPTLLAVPAARETARRMLEHMDAALEGKRLSAGDGQCAGCRPASDCAARGGEPDHARLARPDGRADLWLGAGLAHGDDHCASENAARVGRTPACHRRRSGDSRPRPLRVPRTIPDLSRRSLPG